MVSIVGIERRRQSLGWFVAWLVSAPFAVLGAAYAWQVGLGYDSHAYWSAVQRMDQLYAAPALSRDAYLYSPLFAQLVWPLGRLPWPGFALVWSALGMAAFVWLLQPLSGRWFWPALVATVPEVLTGNIYALMALALVLGADRGSPWLLPTLTKVTPSLVAVGWLAASRQWRTLIRGVRSGVVLVAASVALAPTQWAEWVGFLCGGTASGGGNSLPWLLLGAAGAGLGVAVYAGVTGRAWLLPVSVILVSPTLGVNTLTVLAAVPRLRQVERGGAASRT